MRFLRITLEAPERRVESLTAFYLGLGVEAAGPSSLAIGETTLEFVAGVDEAFYHFALLLPGNRFEPALEWARSRTDLLPDAASGEEIFDFANWNACAFYFHDPAGNIVELIAHRGVAETEARGEFEATELVGLSELGLVGDVATMAAVLRAELGLELWDGTVEPGRLAFLGEQARTIILSPPGRGWLPTRRAAASFSVEALLEGPAAGSVELESRYRIKTVAA